MSDSVVELVTKNIVSTLNGQTITHALGSETLTCERARIDEIYGNRYPIIVLANPVRNNVVNRSRTVEFEAHYDLRFMHYGVVDKYKSSETVKSVSEIFGSMPDEIHKLIMADHTRGGNAVHTMYEGGTDYLDEMEGMTVYCISMLYVVKVTVRWNDFYYTAGGGS